MNEVQLVFPEQPWREFHQKTLIAQARCRLYEDRTFRDLWLADWSEDKVGSMYDRAVELGEDPELASLIIKDIISRELK